MTVLKSAGNLTRDVCCNLNAEKIQRVNVLCPRGAQFFAGQQFSNASAAGRVRKFPAKVNWREWQLPRQARSLRADDVCFGNEHAVAAP